jgi:hypothetical protein
MLKWDFSKLLLVESIICFFLGSSLILFTSDMDSGGLFIWFAFFSIQIFYYRLARTPGSGYKKYEELLDIIAIISVNCLTIVQYLVRRTYPSLVIAIVVLCVIHIVFGRRIYKKHFPEETGDPSEIPGAADQQSG